MKRFTLMSCLLVLALNTYAQSIPYPKVQTLFNQWKNSKGQSVSAIGSQLKTISPKWKLQSDEPTIEGDSKYYVWKASEGTSETYFAIYVEEDETTVAYSLKYIFNNQGLYNNFTTSLKASKPDKISSFTDKSKGEFTLTAEKARIDYFLRSFSYQDEKSASDHKAYSIEIATRYINK